MKSGEQSCNDYRLPVPLEFEAVFSHFYFAENRSANPVTKTLLPSFRTIMVFNLSDK
jgi:hypothetical protein